MCNKCRLVKPALVAPPLLGGGGGGRSQRWKRPPKGGCATNAGVSSRRLLHMGEQKHVYEVILETCCRKPAASVGNPELGCHFKLSDLCTVFVPLGVGRPQSPAWQAGVCCAWEKKHVEFNVFAGNLSYNFFLLAP